MAGFAVSLLIVAGTLQAGLSDILAPTYCFAVLLGARLVYAVFASGALPAISSFIASRALEDDLCPPWRTQVWRSVWDR
jgi:hypothetical protein